MSYQRRRTLTLMNNYSVSNPGRLRISYFHWVRSFPTGPLYLLVIYPLLIALALKVHWSFWIAVALLLVGTAFSVIRAYEKFIWGDTKPAVVVSTEPPLVAVYS